MVFYSPVQIIAKGATAGKYKTDLSVQNMLIRGFMAGAYIAMGAALATTCYTGTAEFLGVGMAKLILGATFPVGLIIIVATGAELFTGDAMLAPLAAFIHKISWKSVFNLWIWVYIGNLIGSVFFAYIMANGPFVTFDATGAATVNAFGLTAVNIALAKVSYVGIMGSWSLFLKAVGCNWLVNLAILLGICADDLIGKFFGIWFPIMAFVSSGFEHCVANMYFIPAGIFAGAPVAWADFFVWNLIPVTIGNIIGGGLFIGVVYYYCFRKELSKE